MVLWVVWSWAFKMFFFLFIWVFNFPTLNIYCFYNKKGPTKFIFNWRKESMWAKPYENDWLWITRDFMWCVSAEFICKHISTEYVCRDLRTVIALWYTWFRRHYELFSESLQNEGTQLIRPALGFLPTSRAQVYTF